MGGASAAPESPGAVTGPDSTPRRAFNSLAVTAHDQPMKQGVLNSVLVRLGDRSPHRALAPTSHLRDYCGRPGWAPALILIPTSISPILISRALTLATW